MATMWRTPFSFVVIALLLVRSLDAAPAEWGDRRLPVSDGLIIWLDAAGQSAARAAHQRGAIESGGLVDVWYDSSGRGHHLVQRTQSAQPRFLAAGQSGVVGFDGVDDHLALTGIKGELKEFTAILVAAPRRNGGYFRAFLAINETGKNDYLTGFTLDQSGQPTDDFSAINIEGRGFQGAVNQMRQKHAFGGFHIITASTGAGGDDAVKLFIDGEAQNSRARAKHAGPLKMDDITLAARFYSNDGDPPRVSGFLHGDIAEVLLFDRALGDADRAKVEAYLRDKHEALLRLKPGESLDAVAKQVVGVPLKKERPGGDAVGAPPVQMFVPGFTVRELPVKLTNINNLRYRHDGRLVALGYDGRIHLLTDSDGDGLEDKATVFWDKGGLRGPIGMALTPPGYPHGTGVFVASKGKVSLIVDTNGDDKADKEIVVASGWREGWHNVDAVGVAVDKDGSIYFGIGCANFANPYLTDKDGNNAQYDIKSDFGTIQKVSPDFKKRETVCTGVRFSIGLAINRHGDLFATDQEGATWLPGGNALDELLHIQPGKHYGFPPRHSKHLPNVVDEPAVELYGPQHQSTCGIVFNEHLPAEQFKGWKHFGPAGWKGDALIAGQSRGKIYRTTLMKKPGSSGGYTARSSIIAGLGMLTVDVCVSPTGDLLAACHSGPPDWGTGPAGAGRLFKISYSDPTAPQPVAVAPRSPVELRVRFDKPLDGAALAGVGKEAEITYGEFVRAGDRFEQLKPPYEVVKQQDATPRFALAVAGVSLADENRTLVLHTAPHPVRGWYALRLPGAIAGSKSDIDLDYSLVDAKDAWVPDRTAASLVGAPSETKPVEVAQGNWLRGQRLYMDEAKCATCHQVRGIGRNVGPDLSNLPHRDVASIIRDIMDPSATINPDHVTYTVTLKDGSELTGVLRSEANDRLRLIDSAGKDTLLMKGDVTEFRASALSTMPTGYDKLLGGEKLADLLAFLRTEPPSMPRELDGVPPARSRAEVEAVLAGAPESSRKSKSIRVVLVAGRKDHGKGEHDYPAWQRAWSRLLAMADQVKVETAWDFPTAEQFKAADAIVFYQQGTWTKERAAAIDAFLARGGGLTYIHYAVDGGKESPEFARRIGFAWVGGGSKFRHGPLRLVFSSDVKHPVARNFSKLNLHDESYWQLVGDPKNVAVLATGDEDGKPQPLFWSYEKDKGRVFVSIPGHYSWTFDDPLFRVLLLRGIAWSAGEPVDRFNELVWPGASVKE